MGKIDATPTVFTGVMTSHVGGSYTPTAPGLLVGAEIYPAPSQAYHDTITIAQGGLSLSADVDIDGASVGPAGASLLFPIIDTSEITITSYASSTAAVDLYSVDFLPNVGTVGPLQDATGIFTATGFKAPGAGLLIVSITTPLAPRPWIGDWNWSMLVVTTINKPSDVLGAVSASAEESAGNLSSGLNDSCTIPLWSGQVVTATYINNGGNGTCSVQFLPIANLTVGPRSPVVLGQPASMDTDGLLVNVAGSADALTSQANFLTSKVMFTDDRYHYALASAFCDENCYYCAGRTVTTPVFSGQAYSIAPDSRYPNSDTGFFWFYSLTTTSG
jgi:hypothetical protein